MCIKAYPKSVLHITSVIVIVVVLLLSVTTIFLSKVNADVAKGGVSDTQIYISGEEELYLLENSYEYASITEDFTLSHIMR